MKKSIIGFALLLSASASIAGNMTNLITGLYDTNTVPTATNPVLCIQTAQNGWQQWNYNQQLNPYKYSGNPNYFGVAVREGGCSDSNIYYGWINASSSGITYQAPAGSHIQLINLAQQGNNLTGTLGFTLLGATDNSVFPTNSDTTNPSNVNWFSGINLSGFEFSTAPNGSVLPDLSQADETTPDSDLASTAAFLNQGANTIRLPIRWEYMQPIQNNSPTFDPAGYFNKLIIPTLETITSHDYYVILDLHAYMHYATVGNEVAGCGGPDGQCPDGVLVTDPQAYVAIWSQIWQAIQNDPKIKADHILIDIVNEPTDPNNNLTAQEVFAMETAVINKLQIANFPGYFLVEGVSWSGLHSWTSAGNAAVFTRSNFQQAGVTNLNNVIINVHQYFDANFSGTQDTCQTDLTTTGPNGFNLQDFVNYLQTNQLKGIVTEFGAGTDQTTCAPTMNGFLQYLKTNAYSASKGYGFVGFTAWSTGHGWGNYNLLIQPTDWKDSIIKNYF